MKSLPHELWADLIGKPYKHHARGPEAYDCYGLVLEMNRRMGAQDLIDLPYADNIAETLRDLPISDILKSDWIACPNLPGTTLIFSSGLGGSPRHCGVSIDGDRFIHSSGDHKTTLIGFLSRPFPPYRRWLIGSFQHKSLHHAV